MKKQQTNKPFLDSLLMQISDYQVLATVLSIILKKKKKNRALWGIRDAAHETESMNSMALRLDMYYVNPC
jgi:hypothetical protein